MNRLSVRLFVSYLAVVLVSTGVAFVTARSLAPTFFRVSLEQTQPDVSPRSTAPAPSPDSEPTATTGTDSPGPSTGQTIAPDGPHTSGATTAPTGPGGPASTQPRNGANPPGNEGNGSDPPDHGPDAAVDWQTGTLAAGTVPTTIVQIDEGVNEAFLDAVNGALLAGLAVALMVSLLAAWLVSRRIMRPISAVRVATVRLAEGNYHERVPAPAEEELADLAEDVNRLAATLDATETRRRRLISEVAHELRTPLTTIQGSMEALMDGVLTPSDAVYASVAEEAGRLQRVVSDLGLLSRLDESALPLAMASIDAGDVVARVVERLRSQFDDQGVRLVESGLHHLAVEGDQDRLAQVFTNLIGNALGHTSEGGTVSVAGRAVGEEVEITVTDDGDGIDPEEIERIFERFHRGKANRRQGSGLGLTIARSIARAHGGDVAATSPGPGRGSTFTVRLPLATKASTVGAGPASPTAP